MYFRHAEAKQYMQDNNIKIFEDWEEVPDKHLMDYNNYIYMYYSVYYNPHIRDIRNISSWIEEPEDGLERYSTDYAFFIMKPKSKKGDIL